MKPLRLFNSMAFNNPHGLNSPNKTINPFMKVLDEVIKMTV